MTIPFTPFLYKLYYQKEVKRFIKRKLFPQFMVDLSDVVLELEGKIVEGEERELWLQRAREKKLWNYQQMQVYEAQQLAGNLGKGVKVGIIDSGIDYQHEQFRHSRIQGANVSGSGSLNDLSDMFGHGTQVASIICGEEIGIAPEVDLYVVKIHEGDIKKDKKFDFVAAVALSLRLCEDEGCEIVNLSLGTPRYSLKLKTACQRAYEKGILLIASSGNKFTGANFPASFTDYVLSVGSINSERKYESGNVWSRKDVIAPGKDILTASTNQKYYLCEGTSFATAHVTGIAALAVARSKEKNKPLSPRAFRLALRESADKSVVDVQQARDFMKHYDPEQILLKDADEVASLMFGAGLPQANKLAYRL